MSELNLLTGDCRKILPKLPAASFDCVITDPPYPCINRSYGCLNEEEWAELMDEVVPQVRRVLEPTGSAVFVLKPNSESAGRMRLWVHEFIVTWGRKWNLVQDCYSWNFAQLPFGASTTCGLMRGSVSHCVWFGAPDCYRNQDAVLWEESEQSKYRKAIARSAAARGAPHRDKYASPSASKRPSQNRLDTNRAYAAADRRGGVTPFNMIPSANTKNAPGEAGSGHPARTSPDVARFWTRYICPPGGTILDCFAGSGVTLEVAAEEGRNATGVEIDADYAKETRTRLALGKRKRA